MSAQLSVTAMASAVKWHQALGLTGLGVEVLAHAFDDHSRDVSKELLELAYQYQSDLRHPPTADSVERRLERIAAVLKKVEA
jgi:hypothetical protein